MGASRKSVIKVRKVLLSVLGMWLFGWHARFCVPRDRSLEFEFRLDQCLCLFQRALASRVLSLPCCYWHNRLAKTLRNRSVAPTWRFNVSGYTPCLPPSHFFSYSYSIRIQWTPCLVYFILRQALLGSHTHDHLVTRHANCVRNQLADILLRGLYKLLE